jgi:transposase
VLRGRDVEEVVELKRQGLSIRAISRLTGYDRTTISKYLSTPAHRPVYGPRTPVESKLEPFKRYLKERLQAGVWNASVLLREIRERGYGGGYTILTDWLRPQRKEAESLAVRRFETPAGKQAQADWGHLGTVSDGDGECKLWGFTITLGYSRRMFAAAAVDQKLGTLLRMHEAAFYEWGVVPDEILYDRMKTVWTGIDERGEIVWNAIFLDFARYWGFNPRLCRPYRAQTKGKVESGVKFVRRNFLCGLQGREPSGLLDLNGQLRWWIAEVANQRVHGTTHEQVMVRWEADRAAMHQVNGRLPYPYTDDEQRKVARDAYVAWKGSRYSVPWRYAGKDVWVRDHGPSVEIRYSTERIAVHAPAARRHQVVTLSHHHVGIPTHSRQSTKTLIHIAQSAPVVEHRPLAAYEAVACGGAL